MTDKLTSIKAYDVEKSAWDVCIPTGYSFGGIPSLETMKTRAIQQPESDFVQKSDREKGRAGRRQSMAGIKDMSL